MKLGNIRKVLKFDTIIAKKKEQKARYFFLKKAPSLMFNWALKMVLNIWHFCGPHSFSNIWQLKG